MHYFEIGDKSARFKAGASFTLRTSVTCGVP